MGLCVSAGKDQHNTTDTRSPKATVLLFAVVCVCCVPECVCFPNGSVAFSCSSLMPVHPPFVPSTDSPPYTVAASSATYRPGAVITVSMEVTNSSADFQGFMLQARSTAGNALLQPVGKFTSINTTMFTPLNCNNMENSSVSQASGANKKKVQLTWEAPGNSNYGDIYFSATLVKNYAEFWVQLNSTTVTLERSGSSAVRVCSSALLFSLLSVSMSC